jgi:hypothetical protein
MARPKKYINQDQFEDMCALQCTKEEICSLLDVTDKTLDRWIKETYGKSKSFSEVFATKRQIGFVSLRRAQFQRALKDTTMSIWLGKIWLGQRETAPLGSTEKPRVVIID